MIRVIKDKVELLGIECRQNRSLVAHEREDTIRHTMAFDVGSERREQVVWRLARVGVSPEVIDAVNGLGCSGQRAVAANGGDGMITIERSVHFQNGRRSRKTIREGQAAVSAPVERVPRISRLMALAIRFDQLIRDGVVSDQAELARLGHVTRARLTQIMNLLCLAPDIQEELLFLPPAELGRDAVTEKQLRPIAAMPSWADQREVWRGLARRQRLPATCL